MATLTAQRVAVAGTQITYAAAAGGGDKFTPGDHREFRVKNGDATATTVTIAVPGNTAYGQANPDIAASIPAGQEWAFGPFPSYFGDPADSNLIAVTYSKVTSLTVAVVDV